MIKSYFVRLAFKLIFVKLAFLTRVASFFFKIIFVPNAKSDRRHFTVNQLALMLCVTSLSVT